MNERKKNLLIVAFGISIALLILGMLLLLMACHGECGSDVHGGMLTWVCPRVYCPKVVSITMSVIGAVGMIVSSCFLIFSAKSKGL